jgi:Copper amine oxidase N-terminal domain.
MKITALRNHIAATGAFALVACCTAAGVANAQTTTTVIKSDVPITVSVNNEVVGFTDNAGPRVVGGRVMVPLRVVTERLGGVIQYDAKSKVITGAHAATSNQFRLRIGTDEALLNGQKMELDAYPRVYGGTTYVPLRFVSEALGAVVDWNDAKRTVIITVEGQPTNTPPAASVD